jgi:branched-chain amino acid transport system permease protein
VLLETLVGGVALGFLYGLVALTLILLVRTTGVLNFAAADVGMLCAFIAFAALTQWKLPVLLALAIAGLFTILLGALIYGAIILVKAADPVMLSLRTLGLLIIVRAVADKLWGQNSPYTFPRILPAGAIDVFGLYVSHVQVAIIALTVIVSALLALITGWTRIGLMLRAVSSDREAAADLGVPVVRVDLIAWCLATFVAGLVGILVAQLNFLAPDMMAPILLAGFAAAQLGDMHSVRAAIVAGLALGIIQSASSVYLNQPEWSQLLAFLVLTVGLLVRGYLRKKVVVT